jgi:hypothetical protein
MGCCNELATALETATFDPTEHVNFTKGMVLGVDDFRQEFAYLSGRDEWLARDAVGYGTLAGLHVFVEESGAEGPRLHVTAGSALVPGGKHVCVGADQCAVLNKWLAKPGNAAIVNQILNPGSATSSPPLSPPASPADVTSGTISLYLTLCYADCTAFPVPIPGEPCRSEADLMADSRVVDDFRLELRKDPPAQVEEDALRDFVRWLHANVQPGAGTSPPGDEAAWLAALHAAVQPWLDAEAMSPPLSPSASAGTLGDYLFDLSPAGVQVGDGQMCDFLRVAFRFWVTELRPMWMARICHVPMVKDQDCVLLARVEFDVEFIGGSPTGAWQVAGSPAIVAVDESTRPFLVHLRLVQEWMMCGCDCAGLGAAFGMGGGVPGSMPLFLSRGPVAPGPVVPRLPLLVANASLTLDESHYFVVFKTATRAVKVTLPVSDAASAGRSYVVRNVDASSVSVQAQPGSGDTVEDKASLQVKKKTAITLVADGEGGWWLAGTAQ